MRRRFRVLAALAVLISAAASSDPSRAAPLEHRWVYLATNLLVDRNVEDFEKLMDRAAKADQGRRVLTLCSCKDLEHVFIVPTTSAAFHGHAVFVGVLLQQ